METTEHGNWESFSHTTGIPKTIAPPIRERPAKALRRVGSRLSIRRCSKYRASRRNKAEGVSDSTLKKNLLRAQSENDEAAMDKPVSGEVQSEPKTVSFCKFIQTFDDKYVSSRRNSFRVFLKLALKGGTQKRFHVKRREGYCRNTATMNVASVEETNSQQSTLLRRVSSLRRLPSDLKHLVFGEDQLLREGNARNSKLDSHKAGQMAVKHDIMTIPAEKPGRRGRHKSSHMEMILENPHFSVHEKLSKETIPEGSTRKVQTLKKFQPKKKPLNGYSNELEVRKQATRYLPDNTAKNHAPSVMQKTIPKETVKTYANFTKVKHSKAPKKKHSERPVPRTIGAQIF